MKIIENTCKQPRPYADSIGYLKIELEPGDDRDSIIKQYHKEAEHWYESSCIYLPNSSTENLLVFKNHSPFLD